jgi:prophage endopeptidase
MNRTELIFGMAIILFVAFALGWFGCWLLNRFARVPGAETDELERLAQALHEAEETRDEAIIYLQQREAELSNRIAQTEAELRAAMDGLRTARGENEQLRSQLEHRR